MLNKKPVAAESVRTLYDKILVMPDDGERVSKGGIIIPDMAYQRAESGIVAAVGHGRLMNDGTVVAPVVKVGDRVLFSRHRAAEVDVNETMLLILPEEDVYATLK